MKVGILIHSQTGNTLLVGEKIKEALTKAGHEAEIEQVKPVNEDAAVKGNIELKTKPEIKRYDALIFGAPVWGFSLSPVMKLYLAQISSLNHKKTGGFVTQFFPFSWMGGNRAIRQLKKACGEKEGKLSETGVINWKNRKREKQIQALVERLRSL